MSKLVKALYVPSVLCFLKETETFKVPKHILQSTNINKSYQLARFVHWETTSYCLSRTPLSTGYLAIPNEAKTGFVIFKVSRTGAYITHPDWIQEDTTPTFRISHERLNQLLDQGPLHEQTLVVLLKKDHSGHLVTSEELASLNTISEQDILSQIITNPKEGYYYLSSKHKGEYLCLGFDLERDTYLFYHNSLLQSLHTLEDILPCKELHRDLTEIPLNLMIRTQNKILQYSRPPLEQWLNQGFTLQQMSFRQVKESPQATFQYFVKQEGLSHTFSVDKAALTEIVSTLLWQNNEVQAKLSALEETHSIKFDTLPSYTERLKVFVHLLRYEERLTAYAHRDMMSLDSLPPHLWPVNTPRGVYYSRGMFQIEQPLYLTIEDSQTLGLTVVERKGDVFCSAVSYLHEVNLGILHKNDFFEDRLCIVLSSPEGLVYGIPSRYAREIAELNIKIS